MGEARFQEEAATGTVKLLNVNIWSVGRGGQQGDDMFLAAERLEVSKERWLVAAFDEEGIEIRLILFYRLVKGAYVEHEFCWEGEELAGHWGGGRNLVCAGKDDK